MFLYESHMGGLYTDNEDLNWEDLYCEACGDCDWCLGNAETIDEAWNLIKQDVDIDNSGGWDFGYIKEFLKLNFNATDKQLDKLVDEEIKYRKENPNFYE